MRAGSHHSPAARMKMSQTHTIIKQIPWNKGKRMSDEARTKMRAAKMGKRGHPHCAEAREKIRTAMLGKRHALGCRRSPETRAKMGDYMRGKRGSLSPFWKGGRKRMRAGYIRAFIPEHPHADPKGYVFEHRLVMETHLGRRLDLAEIVHHINGIKDDNRDENLMLFSTISDHRQFHEKMKSARDVERLKKGELVDLVLKSGADLVGKVPAEILKEPKR